MMAVARVDQMRKSISAVMTTGTAVCTFAAVGILLVILSHIALKGVGSLNFRFLVDAPQTCR
jgi:hypothetical protein